MTLCSFQAIFEVIIKFSYNTANVEYLVYKEKSCTYVSVLNKLEVTITQVKTGLIVDYLLTVYLISLFSFSACVSHSYIFFIKYSLDYFRTGRILAILYKVLFIFHILSFSRLQNVTWVHYQSLQIFNTGKNKHRIFQCFRIKTEMTLTF